MKKILAATLAAALGTTALPALAQSAGDWTVGLGLGVVAPKSNNGLLAGQPTTIDNDVRPTITFEYFVRDNIGIELLAATPFEHTATVTGVGTVSTKHLPPTLSVNYHFANDSKFTPFVGAGINYTTFFEESSALGTVSLSDSVGLALHAGLDVAISDKGSLRADLRWIDINSDAYLNGAFIGEAEIDPIVFGLSYIHNF
ncbi:outer membrane protein OmpW [Actibacterium atlanticum]|uniref:Outer membrane protein OmpW n=1 Tax=Actibacterium atlanticum TaxID=1461693 RepID=A0A058ZNF9_9RHOB|nr:OmpW family outer membrane protein [Actibacterium atlanticum]KCV83159.1 outer membrane protein OmpW [Actibacterium atlanticum]